MPFAASSVLADVAGPNTSILMFVIQAFSSWGPLFASLAALGIFIGAYRLVARKSPPAILAAYLVLLPLPTIIFICDFIKRLASCLMVISVSPQLEITRSDLTAGVAADLVSLLMILLMTAPTYALLAYGLLSNAMNSTGGRKADTIGSGNPILTPRPA